RAAVPMSPIAIAVRTAAGLTGQTAAARTAEPRGIGPVGGARGHAAAPAGPVVGGDAPSWHGHPRATRGPARGRPKAPSLTRHRATRPSPTSAPATPPGCKPIAAGRACSAAAEEQGV